MTNAFPQATLYHYASLTEFQQILGAKSVWLTPVDAQAELDAALGFIRQVITTAYPGLDAGDFNLGKIGAFPEYSLSLTSQKDLQSEWAKYYPNGGFAIAIDQAQLSATMDTCNLSLSKCFYDDGEKKDFVINTIIEINPGDYTNSIAQSAPTCPLDPRQQMFERQLRLINRNILNYAGLLKDASRADEQEWRILAPYNWQGIFIGPTDIDPDPLLLDRKPVGESNLSLTHLEAPLATGADKVTITEVVIGPNPDMPQAKLTCQSLVSESSSPGSVTITESVIPYASGT